MALVLNEEQRFLQESARDFLADKAPVEALRKLRDERDPLGYSQALWTDMARLGWASIILPEQYGGLDFGFTGLGVVMEETGRKLTASPLFASAVVGASALLLGGTESQKAQLLPRLAAGELTLALALEETHHHRPTRIDTRVTAVDGGYLLNGAKTFVLDGEKYKRTITDRQSGLWGVYRFKQGFGGQVVRYVGAYDYVYRPALAWLYNKFAAWR